MNGLSSGCDISNVPEKLSPTTLSVSSLELHVTLIVPSYLLSLSKMTSFSTSTCEFAFTNTNLTLPLFAFTVK